MLNRYLDISTEVKEALEQGKPVVALESTIISHGMPYPQNVETAMNVESSSVKTALCLPPSPSSRPSEAGLTARRSTIWAVPATLCQRPAAVICRCWWPREATAPAP